MNTFFSALGGKLAEKWLSLLVLPGALHVAVVAAACTLSHGRAFDLALLRETAERLAARPASSSPGVILLVAAGVLAAASVVGLTVSALGRGVERLWYSDGTGRPAWLLTAYRLRRWERADERLRRLIKSAVAEEEPATGARARAEVRRARARRNRIGRVRPHGPTWIGDGLHAVDQRIRKSYAVDLGVIWPRLWLVVPDQCRAEITTAGDAHAAAARLYGWAVLYLPVGAVWWPVLPVVVVLILVAQIRARSSSANLTDLVGAAVDLYGRDLARQLGVSGDGPFTRETGTVVDEALR